MVCDSEIDFERLDFAEIQETRDVECHPLSDGRKRGGHQAMIQWAIKDSATHSAVLSTRGMERASLENRSDMLKRYLIFRGIDERLLSMSVAIDFY